MLDFPVGIIQATIQIEQPIGDGSRTVGTGFLLSQPNPDGSPQTILVTANHVLASMPGQDAKLGYRTERADGSWTYTPQPLKIRDDAGAPLWTHHPSRDVAAMRITAPEAFARAAIPANYLAGDDSLDQQSISTGDELMVLGFPRGVAANNAGFPILRSGRIASYPLSPKASPTFLVDFAVFPGNSGGPVFVGGHGGGLQQASTGPGAPLIAGVLTQQVELNNERLEIGIVTHAKYVAETIAMMNTAQPIAPAITAQTAPAETMVGATPAAATTPAQPVWVRSANYIRQEGARIAQAGAAAYRRFTERVLAWIDWRQAPAEQIRQA